MGDLEGTINDIYRNMPYYNELFAGESSISLVDTIDPSDPINGVSRAAGIALQKLQEQLAKVSLPKDDILDRSKSPANTPTLSEVVDIILEDNDNLFKKDNSPCSTKMDGKCLNESLTGRCDLVLDKKYNLTGIITGSITGKGKFITEISTSFDCNRSKKVLRQVTNGRIRGTVRGNCSGTITVGDEVTADGTLTLKISKITLTEGGVKNNFRINIQTNTGVELTTLTKADENTKADLLSNDVSGCPLKTMKNKKNGVPRNGLAVTLADLLNLGGVSYPSLSMVYDSLKAALPLIVKYAPCIAVIVTIITILVGIIKVVLIILEILYVIKPIVEMVRKIIHGIALPTIYATAPELAQDIAVMVLAILKDILLKIPILLWNLISNKVVFIIYPDEINSIC